MTITFDDLQKANEQIKTTDIKGKEYAEVHQRVKAFRMVYPYGTIETTMLTNDNGVCIFRADAYDGETHLSTGHATETEGSTFINRTSYLENAETSAIGRCLGFAGFGIESSGEIPTHSGEEFGGDSGIVRSIGKRAAVQEIFHDFITCHI
jgi:hypothetical protein